jgi:deaminated glutathione amidase
MSDPSQRTQADAPRRPDGDAVLRVACVQLSPGDDLHANVAAALALAHEAAQRGAQLILLPEHALLLHASGRVMRDNALPEDVHPGLSAMRDFAHANGTLVLLGSLTVTTDEERIANRSYLIGADGNVVARYDKLHMFDAVLPNGRAIRESSTYRPGTTAVAAPTLWGLLGMTICYDLRFPQLYRTLAHAGCRLLAVPSAFTQATGQLHWHALLRARAIENAAFVLAPATCGTHPGPHATFGHSLVVAPSGAIVAEAGDEPCVIVADLDLAAVDRARAAIPALAHDRPYELGDGAGGRPRAAGVASE